MIRHRSALVLPVIVPQPAGRARLQARHMPSGRFAAPPPMASTRRARGGTGTLAAAARLRRLTG
jgi:hypothetical protein